MDKVLGCNWSWKGFDRGLDCWHFPMFWQASACCKLTVQHWRVTGWTPKAYGPHQFLKLNLIKILNGVWSLYWFSGKCLISQKEKKRRKALSKCLWVLWSNKRFLLRGGIWKKKRRKRKILMAFLHKKLWTTAEGIYVLTVIQHCHSISKEEKGKQTNHNNKKKMHVWGNKSRNMRYGRTYY